MGGEVVTDLILFLSSLAKHRVFNTYPSSCYVLLRCAALSQDFSASALTFGAGPFFLGGLPYALWGDQQYPVGASCSFSSAMTLKTVSRH